MHPFLRIIHEIEQKQIANKEKKRADNWLKYRQDNCTHNFNSYTRKCQMCGLSITDHYMRHRCF